MTKLGGTNVSEDTDQNAPGQVDTVVAGTNITVNSADPRNPIVSSSAPAGTLTTKGDVQGFDTGENRIPVGADGEVLTADSTTALGVKYAAPAAGDPLTTKGDIIGFDTDADRIPVGTNGQILTADSTDAFGVKWTAPAAAATNVLVHTNDRFAPPKTADFPTVVNAQASVFTDDDFVGMLLYDDTTDTGGDQFMIRVKTMPSGSWTATTKIQPMYVTNQFNGVGLIMRDSATNRNIIFRLFHNGTGNDYSCGVTNYADNSFNSHVLLALDVLQSVQWLRIEDNTTNFLFSISADGVNFHQIASAARTAWLASPDQLGFFIDPENDNPVGLAVSYYDDKDTPAVTAAIFTAGTDIIAFNAGAPGNAAKIHTQVATGNFNLPVGLTNSQAFAEVTATAEATIDIKKNDSSVGTITFAIGANVGTFTFSSEISFVAGDRVQLVNQATADATLADISIHLRRTN